MTFLRSVFHAFLFLLVVSSVPYFAAEACTVFIVGKDASTDGSTMVSHSNDGEFDTDPRLVKIPPVDYNGKQRPVFFSPEDYPRYVGTDRGDIPEYAPRGDEQTPFVPIGYIPQPAVKTFAYLEETYGAVNEKQVAIGESTCSGVFGATPLGMPNGTALFSVDELTHIAMERASTAREAIQLMGDLATEYGFYGAGEFEGTAESLGVTDPTEAWIFHILPDPTGTSAIWVAQRLPDDGFAVLANMFVIRQVDPNDAENFLMSPSVHQVATEYGWWNPNNGALLDFTKIYSDGEYAHKYYSGRRMWGGYRLVGREFPDEYEDLQSDPVYPVFTTPAKKVSELDLFRFHRYSYQGTKYDLGAEGNLAGGPFGTPDRWKAGLGEKQVTGNWERSIGLYRTSDTYVVKAKVESPIGGVLWFGPGGAMGTVFTPFVVGMDDIPVSFRSGHHAVFSRESAFWASCYVQNLANLKWSYTIKDIQARQYTLETESLVMVSQISKEFEDHNDMNAVNAAFSENAAAIVESLWLLADEIMFKYASGFVNEPDNMSQMVGYPAWWLDAVGYAEGPPPPPTEPKCCHPPKPDRQEATLLEGFLTGKAAMREYLRRTSRT